MNELPLFDEPEPEVAAAPAMPQVLQPSLFGADPTERIVAAEVRDDNLVTWRRSADDCVTRDALRVAPWILLCEPDHAPPGAAVEELDGQDFRYLVRLKRWEAYRSVRLTLLDRHAEHIAYAGAKRAALTATGITLFKGMSMRDVRRMQVDIETAGLSPERPSDRILLIAVADNRGLLTTLEGAEPAMLQDLISLIAERDPDVIEGHNIHGFDLPFIAARCRRHGVEPALGRDGMLLEPGPRRTFSIGGITRPVVPWHIGGRHVIDTFLAVQRFDWAKGALTGYGLKEVARSLGISAEDRIELPRDEMERLYRTDRERVVTYARQDVIETARLAELVTATEFYQTQMVPDGYGEAAISGAGEKINAIFIRAYLHAGRAIPRPLPARPYEGGYTEVRQLGVVHRVVKADVESLYPSIMLSSGIHPRTDTLGVFLPVLRELTQRRLEAKGKAHAAAGRQEYSYWDGLQSSFKVLINSFYGYLGAAGFNFNDPDAAAKVTRIGRALVRTIADTIESSGGSVIEIDTDGVYFTPPPDVPDEDAERAFIRQAASTLPEGIRLAFDGRYRSMVSVKTKNYVLLDYAGHKTYRGASLRSRADEPFGTAFLARALDLMLDGRTGEIKALYLDTIRALQQHLIPVRDLARRERVTEKTFASPSRRRLALAAEGAAIGDYVTVYERANGELGRVEDHTFGDESVTYYVERLYKFACRLKDAIGQGFDELVPRPSGGRVAVGAGLDLFGDT